MKVLLNEHWQPERHVLFCCSKIAVTADECYLIFLTKRSFVKCGIEKNSAAKTKVCFICKVQVYEQLQMQYQIPLVHY